MVVSFLQILQESVKKLMPGGPRDTATLPPTAIFAMLSTVIVKGIIWIFCINIKTTQVQALAQGRCLAVALRRGLFAQCVFRLQD